MSFGESRACAAPHRTRFDPGTFEQNSECCYFSCSARCFIISSMRFVEGGTMPLLRR